MAGTDLEVRRDEALQNLNQPAFLTQVERLLPDTLPLRKFVQVAATAIRMNPDLVSADQNSLFGSIIRCAQDGLIPDNREAALVPYKGKVSYLPMIGGVRKIAAEYGWTIRTRVVYENDSFEHVEEPPSIRHVPVRPGVDRGELVAAYAVATHVGGRRVQKVLYKTDIDKRRAKAQTDRVWQEWEPQMWEKTVGHAIAGELPRSDSELAARLTALERGATVEPAAAAELLYGPDGTAFTATPVSGERVEVPAAADEAPGTGGASQQAEPADSLPAAGSAPDDDEPEPGPIAGADDDPAAAEAAAVIVPNGTWQGITLQEVADAAEGPAWLAWALARPGKFDEAFYSHLRTFVQHACPDIWDEHERKQAA